MSSSSATEARVGPRGLPPFRADHVGSLLRPRELVQARAARKAGTLSADALRAVEDRCIAAAIRQQEDLGLPAFRLQGAPQRQLSGRAGLTRAVSFAAVKPGKE